MFVYEMAVVLRPDLEEEAMGRVKTLMADCIQSAEGKILLQDDWGKRSFAWPIQKGLRKGQFLYYIYEADGKINKELDRRLGIDDAVVRSMCIKLGNEKKAASSIKNYKSPFAGQA